MKRHQKVEAIVTHYNSRNRGNSTYLLTSAIHNPNVTIIARNNDTRKFLEREYKRILRNQPRLKRVYWRLFGRKNPNFSTLETFRTEGGFKTPIVFDLSALYA